MKPFWFAFNTADWLSSKSVRMMSLAERGAYIGLLATAWGENQAGTLPAAEDIVRRLSEMSVEDWKVSGPVILALFPLSECGTFRYNPRLLNEAGKREELSEKKAEAGRKSAERRAAVSTERQQNANTNPTPVEINLTGVAKKGNQLQSQLQLHSSKEEGKSPPLSPALQARLVALPDTSGEIPAEDSLIAKPEYFKRICDELGLGAIDHEHYRRAAALAAKGEAHRMGKQWESWVAKFFTNQKQRGPLLAMETSLPTKPTPESEYPAPGKERPGQLIAFSFPDCDQVMARMKAATKQKYWPTAQIYVIPNRY